MKRALLIVILVAIASIDSVEAFAEIDFSDCKTKAQTTQDTNECLAAEYNAVKKDLEEKTSAMKQVAIDTDKAEPGYNVAEKFAQGEKAFSEYKKTQCEFEGAKYTTGTFAGIAAQACEIELMRQRAKMIELM